MKGPGECAPVNPDDEALAKDERDGERTAFRRLLRTHALHHAVECSLEVGFNAGKRRFVGLVVVVSVQRDDVLKTPAKGPKIRGGREDSRGEGGRTA